MLQLWRRCRSLRRRRRESGAERRGRSPCCSFGAGAGACGGGGVTFDEFVEARLQALLRYAVMLTGDPHTAQDLVQDTMIRAQLKWRRIAAADLPERYVKRMITNAYV